MTSTTDDNAPATKRDLKNLQQKIDIRFKDVDVQFQTVMKYVRTEAEETRRHFDVIAEDIKHDFKGAFHDKLGPVCPHPQRYPLTKPKTGLIKPFVVVSDPSAQPICFIRYSCNSTYPMVVTALVSKD